MKPAVLTLVALVLATCLTPGHASAGTESHGSMNNHPPKVIQIEGMPEKVIPLAGGERQITFGFKAMDPNGWQDIVRAEVALFAPDNVTFLREANVTGVTGGDGASHWFNATFSMWYYELPTHGENYTLRIRVLDQTDRWSNARYAEFEYAELAAMKIGTASPESDTTEESEPVLAFSDAEPGEESSVTEIVISNTGNVIIDLELYGTNLVNEDGYEIPVSAVRYSVEGDGMANETALTLDASVLSTFDLLPGDGSANSVWWRLSLPTGEEQYMPAGTYSGSVTLNALAS